ncbi:dual specificity protein phosphatase 12-like [Impatiens glandulifera]|uniref:dual specificity protein phosphatase 12-like n=1 Tax=Impatiens glandulifera TaxID=253017 RepID=UPI001FB10A03|nr:dual specificity protein phosphatase 12-like [Impatiens glandulifera]
MPYLVRENLFIGDIASAADVLQNGSNEITRILSVVSSASISFFSDWRSNISINAKEICKVSVRDFESDDSYGGESDDRRTSLSPDKLLYAMEYAGKDLKCLRMAVPLRDTENQNLLDYLNVCLDFIEKSRNEGSVLIHCFAGVSRSAAIMTAYLMRTEQLSQEDALESLRESCEFVCPNDGFLDQLKMFEVMGFKVDHSSIIYKRFRLKVLGDSYNRGEVIDSSKFAADPGILLPKANVSAPSEIESSSLSLVDRKFYRCKKCHRLVALQENALDHVPGEGENSFGWRRRRHACHLSKPEEFECSSIFVEPLRWMKLVEEGALEGKLFCNNCEGRLGCFNWSGIQCSCGSWIKPAFQLHKSKLDISRV